MKSSSRQFVIARSGSRIYFKDIKNGEILTTTKKNEAYRFYTREGCCNMCLTLSMSGFPSDLRPYTPKA